MKDRSKVRKSTGAAGFKKGTGFTRISQTAEKRIMPYPGDTVLNL